MRGDSADVLILVIVAAVLCLAIIVGDARGTKEASAVVEGKGKADLTTMLPMVLVTYRKVAGGYWEWHAERKDTGALIATSTGLLNSLKDARESYRVLRFSVTTNRVIEKGAGDGSR